MKKISLSISALLVLVAIGGCTSRNNNNETSSSSIEVSATSDSATNPTGDSIDSMRTDGDNARFKVE
ncbi:hypothetical protein [Enterococcus innesii]|nr:hypothetical protein [Enterococcus innesii]